MDNLIVVVAVTLVVTGTLELAYLNEHRIRLEQEDSITQLLVKLDKDRETMLKATLIINQCTQEELDAQHPPVETQLEVTQ